MGIISYSTWGSRDQEAREERQRLRRERGGVPDPDDGLGSFDDGDPCTTNLYVGNLAPGVDEEVWACNSSSS